MIAAWTLFGRLHSLLFVILMARPSVQHQELATYTAFGALMGMATTAQLPVRFGQNKR
jgi:hypothetical protein